jgi:hypothetical protein
MKRWYQSKTLWFNVAVAIGAAIEASLTLVQGYFDPRVFLALIGLVAGVNVVLRFLTTTGVSK